MKNSSTFSILPSRSIPSWRFSSRFATQVCLMTPLPWPIQQLQSFSLPWALSSEPALCEGRSQCFSSIVKERDPPFSLDLVPLPPLFRPSLHRPRPYEQGYHLEHLQGVLFSPSPFWFKSALRKVVMWGILSRLARNHFGMVATILLPSIRVTLFHLSIEGFNTLSIINTALVGVDFEEPLFLRKNLLFPCVLPPYGISERSYPRVSCVGSPSPHIFSFKERDALLPRGNYGVENGSILTNLLLILAIVLTFVLKKPRYLGAFFCCDPRWNHVINTLSNLRISGSVKEFKLLPWTKNLLLTLFFELRFSHLLRKTLISRKNRRLGQCTYPLSLIQNKKEASL